jgi:pyruvate dehydrogenase E1 component
MLGPTWKGGCRKSRWIGSGSEVDGGGLSSYPHPRTMPEFWQFPTVSMGLGPIMAIYQARFMKYLEDRGFVPAGKQKVWCFLGDGECDEPETLGAMALAGREKLDNLIFVVNCNLQRLDGPGSRQRQDHPGTGRRVPGAGWNVIKVIWGRGWDKLLAQDEDGRLQRRMDKVHRRRIPELQGQRRRLRAKHFFGADPESSRSRGPLRRRDLETQPWRPRPVQGLSRRTTQAMKHKGQPTVILAKTIKGYGTGAGEAANTAHNTKKLDIESAVRASVTASTFR